MLEVISFYLFSVLIIFCFSVVVFTANVLYAMTALASGMIFIAGIFFNIGAEFLGVVQISVYTGAVMAMYAFGMMFFDSAKDIKEKHKSVKIVCLLSFGVALMLVIIVSLPRLLSIENNEVNDLIESMNISGNVESIGIGLFTNYLIVFELAALMLLVALIAGIALVSKNIGGKFDDTKLDNIKDNL
ncbi:MAG: NADH-quinone oxidoreductase subunit J [Helicobacteraceae bacterium]|nr:NADH-quinone oxidoreductase subunit J [Helicobacteraceae bacterium]